MLDFYLADANNFKFTGPLRIIDSMDAIVSIP